MIPTAAVLKPLQAGRLFSILRAASIIASAQWLAVSAVVPGQHRQVVDLYPKLRTGQTVEYHVSYHAQKFVKTESPVVSGSAGDEAKTEVHALLRLEVLEVQPSSGGRSVIHARTSLEVLNSDLRFKTPGFEPPSTQIQREPGGKAIEFTIFPDGRIEGVVGLDALFPDQQQAWKEWASRFALGGMLPPNIRVKQKSKSEEPENSPSPIDGLRWIRQSTYVRDEPCRPVTVSLTGELAPSDAAPETCAVILTNASLKQRSSRANATPQAFKVRELRTAGSARGINRIITYISLKTGLVVRSSEEANQNMDVTVAKTDGSNRVRYNVTAKSHSEVMLVSETARTSPKQSSP